MSRDPKFGVPEFGERRCGRLDPHQPHAWTGVLLNRDEQPYFRREGDDWRVARGSYRCNGFVVVEGGAYCEEHQATVAECRLRHERERRARWSE